MKQLVTLYLSALLLWLPVTAAAQTQDADPALRQALKEAFADSSSFVAV